VKVPVQRISSDRYAFRRGPQIPGSSPEAWGKLVEKSVRAARKVKPSRAKKAGVIEPHSSEEVVAVPDDAADLGAASLVAAQQPERSKKPQRTPALLRRPLAPERSVTWRYLPTPRVRAKHALDVNFSNVTGHANTSRCGLYCWDSAMWHGSGSQGEHDKLDRLPRCKHCERTLAETSPTEDVADGTGTPGWKSRGQSNKPRVKSQQQNQED
jgi:hypothetical protein